MGPRPGDRTDRRRSARRAARLADAPAAVAEAYWALYSQPKSAWTFEQEIRPFGETW